MSTKVTHGGARPRAGRPKSRFKKDAPHRERPELSPRHPVHCVLRVMPYVTELRTRARYNAIRRVLERYLGNPEFRVVHLSLQDTHLHLLVEAAGRDALTWGMQSFAINAARALNKAMRKTGRVFAYRYHATQIRTPRQARNSLAYVLNNWRRHNADLRALNAPVDVYSSGVRFDGWSKRVRVALPERYVPLPTSPPRTGLLASGYTRFGRIDPFETPATPW